MEFVPYVSFLWPINQSWKILIGVFHIKCLYSNVLEVKWWDWKGSRSKWQWETMRLKCPIPALKHCQNLSYLALRYAVCGHFPLVRVCRLRSEVLPVSEQHRESQTFAQGDPVSKWPPTLLFLTLVWVPGQYHRNGGLHRGVVEDCHSTVAGEEPGGVVIHILHVKGHICLARLAASIRRLGNKAVRILLLSV